MSSINKLARLTAERAKICGISIVQAAALVLDGEGIKNFSERTELIRKIASILGEKGGRKMREKSNKKNKRGETWHDR